MSSKRSRVHPKYKTKCRVTNWPEYDRGLVRRGDLTLWISPEAITTWSPGLPCAAPQATHSASHLSATLRGPAGEAFGHG
jgi:hypothetical protein